MVARHKNKDLRTMKASYANVKAGVFVAQLLNLGVEAGASIEQDALSRSRFLVPVLLPSTAYD